MAIVDVESPEFPRGKTSVGFVYTLIVSDSVLQRKSAYHNILLLK
jgi:hypothetical protein